MIRKILASAILLLSVNAVAQNADEYLQNTLNRIKSYTHIYIEFDCIIDSQIYSGNAYMKGDSYKLIAFDQEIICNGTTKWTYVPDDEEVVVDKVGTNDDNLTPLAILDKIPSNSKASFTAKTNDTKTLKVKGEYDGKQREVMMTIIDKNLQPKEISLIEDNSTKRIVIKTMKTEAFPDSIFTFEEAAHPGVELIDMR